MNLLDYVIIFNLKFIKWQLFHVIFRYCNIYTTWINLYQFPTQSYPLFNFPFMLRISGFIHHYISCYTWDVHKKSLLSSFNLKKIETFSLKTFKRFTWTVMLSAVPNSTNTYTKWNYKYINYWYRETILMFASMYWLMYQNIPCL